MSYPDKTDQEQSAVESMPPMWGNSPIALGFIKAKGAAYQQVEDDLHEILEYVPNINKAFGFMLDTIGLLLNEERKGRLDPEYRTALIEKASVRNASGTTRDIKRIAKAVTGADTCYVIRHYPACTYVFVNAPVNRQEAKVIEEAHIAGVRTRILWNDTNLHVRTTPLSGITRIYAEAGEYFMECGEPDAECGNYIEVGESELPPPVGGFTSLIEGAVGYQVVDDIGELCPLASPSTTPISTGYLIDHEGNYIVDHNGDNIRYID